MEKTKGNQEQEKMNNTSLKNSRYWENVIPQTDRKTPAEEGRVPDKDNPKKLQELH